MKNFADEGCDVAARLINAGKGALASTSARESILILPFRLAVNKKIPKFAQPF
jgi:hypothetical protein